MPQEWYDTIDEYALALWKTNTRFGTKGWPGLLVLPGSACFLLPRETCWLGQHGAGCARLVPAPPQGPTGRRPTDRGWACVS